MRSKKVRAAMIAAAACLFYKCSCTIRNCSGSRLYRTCAGGKRKLVLLQQRTESDKRYKSGTE